MKRKENTPEEKNIRTRETEKSKYTVSDVKKEDLEIYLRYAEVYGGKTFPDTSPEAVFSDLGLAEDGVLLNAGADIFIDDGTNALQINHFASDYRITYLHNIRSTGPMLSIADEALRYVIDKMDWRVEFDGSLERKEIPEVPVSAVRRAVVNAFVHRDIESGKAVELTFFKYFIDIHSPREDPDRNPLIARALTFPGEDFAHIGSECEKAGVKVEFNRDSSGLTIRFYRHCGKEWAWSANPYV